MSRVLYLDCFSGISGDMTLGAFLDAGMPLAELKAALGSLMLDGVDISAAKVLRAGVSATQFIVHEHPHDHGEHPRDRDEHPRDRAEHPRDRTEHPRDRTEHPHDHHEHPHRTLPEIFALIDKAALSSAAKSRAHAMFHRLAEAEAAIHRTPIEQVHLHEVGEIDSIIDIVGAAFAFEWAGVNEVICSPVNVGGGMVKSAHGVFPVPAPATVALLGRTPIYSGAVQQELVTPTGALIATTYAKRFETLPHMTIDRVGYGAGSRDPHETPNVLRLLLGQTSTRPVLERVALIECEIDDMNPQIFGVVMDRLYAAGALEVFYVPVQMKKNRPGTLLTVIGRPENRSQLAEIIFRETTTIGVRHSEVERECLRRDVVPIETPLGIVRFKLAWRDAKLINAAPEFDDCAKLAVAHNLPVKEVQAIAAQAYGASGAAHS